MLDVRDLLDSTTPEPIDLPEVDYDALVRRGARRRVGKRIGAATLALAVLGGSLLLLDEAFGDVDLEIADQPESLPPIVDELEVEPPPAGDWRMLPPAPLDTREDPFVQSLGDGRIVVAGGSLPGSSASRTDGAVLSADGTSWTELPAAPFPDSLMEFTVRGQILWARTAPRPGAPAFAESSARLARLDLDAPTKGWDELPVAPVDHFLEPTVTVFDDTVVVFGPMIDDTGLSLAGGAVWRDGTWTAFDGPPTPVSGAFVGVHRDHLAVVGGQVDEEVIADTAILDLATATWRTAGPMPAGPRIHTDSAASAIVVDGRMFVAGGFADPRVTTPMEEYVWPDPTPSPCPPPFKPDCATTEPSSHSPPHETTANGAADSNASSSSIDRGPSEPSPGAAWLDLAKGTWEEVELPIDDAIVPHAVRPDSLTAPTRLDLGPNRPKTISPWQLDATGEFIHVRLPGLPFPRLFARIELNADGEPVLAVETEANRPRPHDRRVAVPDGGGFVEATLPEPLAGVTYILIDGHLHAFGGIPYPAGRDEESSAVPEGEDDLEQPLLAWVLQR